MHLDNIGTCVHNKFKKKKLLIGKTALQTKINRSLQKRVTYYFFINVVAYVYSKRAASARIAAKSHRTNWNQESDNRRKGE